MLLGIDVGGTHTDAVVLGDDGIQASCKVPTDHADLLASINAALSLLAAEADLGQVERCNLSTTLTTNAIVEGKTEEVGVILAGGPGIDPHNFMLARHYHVLPGATDHRGQVVRELDRRALAQAVAACARDEVRAFAAVAKFSPRNPEFETQIRDALTGPDAAGPADVVTMGHEISGALNFPRRIATAYYNSAAWRLFNNFAYAVTQSLRNFGVTCRVNILKADGGTMPLSLARRAPVESILSGPAASVMGIVAMCDIHLDSVILDIGGTTTDIAIFAAGAPLMEPDGIAIGSHPTLIRALSTRSIGVGGDSAIRLVDGAVRVGPQRKGPSMADGGAHPTLIDACNFLGMARRGDSSRSVDGITALAEAHGLDPQSLAEDAVQAAVAAIVTAVRELTEAINDRPVYTIHELLEGRRIVPCKIYIMGGPAEVFKMPLFRAFSLSVTVPRHHGVANAVGAALARTTHQAELHADTEQRRLTIPALGISRVVEAGYSLAEAEREATRRLLTFLRDQGIPARDENVQITHASSFTMVKEDRAIGRTINVRCQIKPGILHRYRQLLGQLC